MLNNIKAAIFDMDGTIIDSMWVWDKIDKEYLKNKGFELPKNLKSEIVHLSFDETAKYFKDRFNLSDSLETIKNDWHEMAENEYRNNVTLKPGAKEFIKQLKSCGIKIGLATSNSIPLLELVLKKHDVYKYFDDITTTDEVERGKNFPDVYLLAAQKLKVSPDNCIVFEDILPAIMGAKAAGMKVVGVYDQFSENSKEEILSFADIYINGYEEILNSSDNYINGYCVNTVY